MNNGDTMCAWRSRLMAILFVAFLGACGVEEAQPSASQRPNVVWIVIDTLRARNLDMYGYGRSTSPQLSRFAQRGVVFEHMYAQSSWTKPSVASMLTGLRPTTHGAVKGKTSVLLAPGLETFAETLGHAGYQTAGFSENPHISSSLGFDQGYGSFVGLGDWTREQGLASQSIDQALAWLADRDPERPFHLYLQVLDPHSPWLPNESSRSLFLGDREAPTEATRQANLSHFQESNGRVKRVPSPEELAYLMDLYDAELHGVDQALGALFGHLETSGLLEQTIVLVVSDHGEEFLEHGNLKHGYQIYDESIHVPLVMLVPGVAPGRRGDLLLEHVDLMPTLLALLELTPNGPLEGHSFAAHLRDPDLLLLPEHTEALSETEFRHWRTSRALRTTRWKLIELINEKRFTLFDLLADPEERDDVALAHPELVAQMRARMLALLAASPVVDLSGATGTPDAELSKELQAIGYMADDDSEDD